MIKAPKEIKAFYHQLEEIRTFNRWDLVNQIDALNNVYSKEWKNELIGERVMVLFGLNNGKLQPVFSGVSSEGVEIGISDYDNFPDEILQYYKARAEATKNPLLSSRYNHILYTYTKNRLYAIKAIESYKLIANQNNSISINYIQAIIKLTEITKSNINETKQELFEIINDANIKNYERFGVIKELMNCRLCKVNEFVFFPSLCIDWINSDNKNYFFNKEMLHFSITICTKNRIESKLYYEKLAENEDVILSEHMQNGDFLKATILADKMNYYKKAKNIQKYEEARIQYSEAKQQTRLNAIKSELSSELFAVLNEEINKNAQVILKWDSDQIYHYFSVESPLFPDINKIAEIAIKNYNKSFIKHVSSSFIDINANTKKASESDNIEKIMHMNYEIGFNISVFTMFSKVLQYGFLNGKINYFTLYDYLKKKTWLGNNITNIKFRDSDDNEKTHCWLNFMAPALHNMFSQLEIAYLTNNDKHSFNWILCTDSLTLKFEGALRDFVRLTGNSTSVVSKNKEIREMLLDDLLNCEAVCKLFTENDIALFKMVFTSKGDNIRNNVAHCFYNEHDYNHNNVYKIFFCILRLSKYIFIKTSNSEI